MLRYSRSQNQCFIIIATLHTLTLVHDKNYSTCCSEAEYTALQGMLLSIGKEFKQNWQLKVY